MQFIFSQTFSRLFVALKPDIVEKLVEKITLVQIKSGEILYHQGEPGTGIHILYSGRLQIRVAPKVKAPEKVIGTIMPGEAVGEIALLTGGGHAATLVATRNSTLGYLTREDFDAVMTNHPAAKLDVARFIIDRLLDAQSQSGVAVNPIHTLAIVPVDTTLDTSGFTRRLQLALLHFGSTALVDSRMVHAQFPDDLVTGNGPLVAELEHYLDITEQNHDFVVLEADPEPSSWTRKCVSYSDIIVFVTSASAALDKAGKLARDVASLWVEPGPACELVLIHEHRTEMPQQTKRWLDAIPADRHHHVSSTSNQGFKRLARIFSGNAVSLVLGGGGARGFAHIGVIRALREAGVPIDMVGGTSLGAIVGGGVAMGWDDGRMLEEYKAAFVDVNPANDYTLPVLSLIRGEKMSRGLQRHFSDTLIEDLWIPFFAVSSNLSSGHEYVHRTGLLWRSLRASASLPAIFPPIIADSEVLVDGGILNNLPVNVVRDSVRGYVIVVDISLNDEFRYEQEELPTVWEYFKMRLLSSGSLRTIPTIPRVVLKTTMVGSRRDAEAARHQADLFISPPVKNFDMLEWRRMLDISDAGYQYSREQVASWASQHPQVVEHEEFLDSTLMNTTRQVS